MFSLKGCFEGSMEMVEEKMAEKGAAALRLYLVFVLGSLNILL